ncbi:MAG TPA: hypothetical protein DCQ26_01725 [Marinilabiliales bacterium]|nr:MAG: hypothetical protein A2W84_18270 [Bacteroidetes bacterium GWC2_40_13]OFX73109.1 MAG: hypothetical protein A2W96_02240 [Bacteroidetes bacterium GWD2_40_43]OFX95149.1 MAG: hypothetical protein A2W97_11135 [Bacteroidetes bacterium GWE2_40_63]OFY19232.1 MAG: hypothetical protein A2W88_07340 [Bacteroidetes bacterium GWF2_40_13]OFZ30815.1 MAG: hypothetical protein A2437_11545 [Bacteroidetes bacterium RIFOXYC2_FULL_40_12]HAM97303.1 hypothetical protein [Marinilabiliales bacterium]
MPMNRLFLLIVGLLGVLSYLPAQTPHLANSSITTETPDQYYLQVKQFGEFIDRFNYVSDWKGNRIGNDFEAKFPRFHYLGYLFNKEDVRQQNLADSNYRKLCNQFLREVVDPAAPQFISLFSGQVTAKALVNINYRGKNQNCTIYFLPEVLPDRSAKWVISKVETNCFKTVADSLQKYFIAPNSHETSFINLKRIEDLSNPIYFYPSTVITDTSLLFMTEVGTNRLTINNIEKVMYLITFHSWLITVKEFNRTSNNSGWLISNIEKTD